MSRETPRVVVIGAGLAGLAAARHLRDRRMDVCLIDRGQRIGGRLLTRQTRPGGPRFDLGPQYLLSGSRAGRWARHPHGAAHSEVNELLRELNQTHLLHPCQIATIGGDEELGEEDGANPLPDIFPGQVPSVRDGMQTLADLLRPPAPLGPDSTDYCGGTEVTRIELWENRWRVHTRHTQDGSLERTLADAVILAVPVPQALTLLRTGETAIPDDLRTQLGEVHYSRCIAVAAEFPGPSRLPDGNGVYIHDSALAWVTDNQSRQVSPIGPALTGLTSAEWAEQHWDDSDERVVAQLLPLLRGWADGEPSDVAVHRWQYAMPVNPQRVPCAVAAQEPPLVLAGDGFAGYLSSPLDAAYTSGVAAAERTTRLLGRIQSRDRRFTVRRTRRVTLEVGVTSAEEAVRAVQMGADRVELCSGLEVGGLTPSPSTFLMVRRRVSKPVYVLLRPRAGGFTYSDDEFEAMCQDAEWFLEHGANGVVFGILESGSGANRIDVERCRRLVQLANEKAVFHRAFDFLPEPLVALEELTAIGFQRVQTSGGYSTAEAGMSRLAAWIAHAGWQIEILPAGGITPATVGQLLRVTRADQVHASLRAAGPDPSLMANPRLAAAMGAPDPGVGWRTTDARLVEVMRQELDRFVCEPEESPG